MEGSSEALPVLHRCIPVAALAFQGQRSGMSTTALREHMGTIENLQLVVTGASGALQLTFQSQHVELARFCQSGLQRFQARTLCDPDWTPRPTADDGISDPLDDPALMYAYEAGIQTHLLQHGPEGYYVPADLSMPPTLDPNGVLPGGWLGCTQGLLQELISLAGPLGMTFRSVHGRLRRGGGVELSIEALGALGVDVKHAEHSLVMRGVALGLLTQNALPVSAAIDRPQTAAMRPTTGLMRMSRSGSGSSRRLIDSSAGSSAVDSSSVSATSSRRGSNKSVPGVDTAPMPLADSPHPDTTTSTPSSLPPRRPGTPPRGLLGPTSAPAGLQASVPHALWRERVMWFMLYEVAKLSEAANTPILLFPLQLG